jgi:hypothetical protein
MTTVFFQAGPSEDLPRHLQCGLDHRFLVAGLQLRQGRQPRRGAGKYRHRRRDRRED